jgi:hypothetical protein
VSHSWLELRARPFVFQREGGGCSIYARLVGYDEKNVAIADSGDVLISNAFGFGNITSPVKINDPYGRIVSAIIFVGKGTFSHDYGNPARAEIDDLNVITPSTNTIPPPPKPTITINSPYGGQSFNTPYKVTVSGVEHAPGGLFGFCVSANNISPVQRTIAIRISTLVQTDSLMFLYLYLIYNLVLIHFTHMFMIKQVKWQKLM